MGILNITPDSFSDGGVYFANTEKAVQYAKQMIREGADIIDIGGESTRPGSESITEEQERERVIPVIKELRKQCGSSLRISIDTYKAHVAQAALENGASMVNSLGGFTLDKQLHTVIAKFHCPIMIYHIKGKPKTMQKNLETSLAMIENITTFFTEQLAYGSKNDIKRDQFILDPGIGFGKSVAQNLDIIKGIKRFTEFALPIAIGVSRKSHLGTLLQSELDVQTSPLERLEASLAETAVAVLNGASIVRTHDVLQTKKFLAILDQLKSQ